MLEREPIGPELSEFTAELSGGARISVLANTDRLRKDFIHEANLRPGINIEEAKRLAEGVNIYFNYEDFLDHIIGSLEDKGDSVVLKRYFFKLKKFLNHDLESVNSTGEVYQMDPDSPAVFINPNEIAKNSRQFPYREVQELAFITDVYKTWFHERDHLLRDCDPKKKKIDNIIKLVQVASSIPFSLAIGTLYIKCIENRFGQSIEEVHIPNTLYVLILAFSALGSVQISKFLFYNLLDPNEREARAAQSDNNGHLINLFEFSSENG